MPQQLAAQNLVHHAVTVPANLRIKDGKPADDQTARAHFETKRQGDAARPILAHPQQADEPRRGQARSQSQQQVGQDLPISVQLECGYLIKRTRPEEGAHGERGDDGSKNQRTENFHGHGTEDDLGYEHRAGNRSVVGRSHARGRAAGHQQPEARRGPALQTARQRCHHGGKLDQRTFATD